jgi:hypothetical protein
MFITSGDRHETAAVPESLRHERRRRGRERQKRPDRVGHGAEISPSGLDVLAELRRDSRRGRDDILSDKRNKHRGRRLGARRSDDRLVVTDIDLDSESCAPAASISATVVSAVMSFASASNSS